MEAVQAANGVWIVVRVGVGAGLPLTFCCRGRDGLVHSGLSLVLKELGLV